MDDDPIVKLNESEIDVLHIILWCSASLGVVGALFIIITYLLFKEIRIFSTKLIFFLSLSDFLSSVSWYPFGAVNNYLCIVQAMSLQFFFDQFFIVDNVYL